MEKNIENRIRKALAEEKPVSEQSVNKMVLLAGMQWNVRNQKKRVSFSELLWAQIRFIGWKMWIIELFAAFVPAFVLVQYLRLHVITPGKAVCLLSCQTVLISMLCIPFIYRSRFYQMTEIEAATFFSIKRLLLSRLLILFAGELTAIVGVSAMTSMYAALDFGNSMVYMLFLFGISCNGILFLVKRTDMEKLCRYYLVYGFTALFVMMLSARFLPEIFDGTFHTGIALGSFALLGSCIYQSCLLVKGPEEIIYA